MAPLAAAAAAALLIALSAPRGADAFGFNSVVALVVADPVTTFPGASVSIVEVDYSTGNWWSGAVLDSYSPPTSRIPAEAANFGGLNKFTGNLALCGDMTCVSYVAQSSATAGDVIIHRHKDVDTALATGGATTTIEAATFGADLVAKAACSMDGSGYWVVGDPVPIRYVPHGGTQVGVVANAGVGTSSPNINSCQLMAANATSGLPKAMYFEGTRDLFGFVFLASNPTSDWTLAGGISIPAPAAWLYFNGNPYYGKQAVSNRARTRFFVNEPHACGYATCQGIWMCDTSLANCNNANNAYSFWSQDFMYTGGIAMSPDNQRLFYTTAKQIFHISAVGASAGSPVAVGAPLGGTMQYRGISWAPVTPTCGAGLGGSCCTPGMPGYYCAGGVLPLLPCAPGSTSALGGGLSAAACAQCAAGTYSTSLRTCGACSPGISCPLGSSSNTAPCPPGFFCAGGVAPAACSGGIFCPGGATNNTLACPAGYYCPAGGAPVQCLAGTNSSATGQSSSSTCAACPAGSFSNAGDATCSLCPLGYFSASSSSPSCAPCSAGVFCGVGASVNTLQCPVGWYCLGAGRGTLQCPSGTFSGTAGAVVATTCVACTAGRWCPVGSNNTNEICRAGWQCPAGSVANSICQPGYFSGPGASSCTLCQPGSLANVFGATSCTICPAGTYSEPGSTSLVCSPCPQNTYSPNNGAGSRANCITCPLGYSAPPGSTACIAMQWTKMNPSYPLTGRLGGIAVANSTAVIAVGGRDANGVPSSVSLGYDSTTGQMVETFTGDANMTFDRAATAPHPTDGSAWVFGGVDASGLETASLWKLATNTGGRPTVSRVSFPASPAPAARKLGGMAYVSPCAGMTGACLVLIGGDKGGALFGDVWVFDLTLNLWSQPLGTNLNMPSARSGHAVVAAPNSSLLYVFGGTTAAGVSNDVFALSPFGFQDATMDEMNNIALNSGVYANMSSVDPLLGARGPGAGIDGIITSRFTENPAATTPALISTCNCNWCAITHATGCLGSAASYTSGTCGYQNPWWGVDLGSVQSIDFLYLTTRTPTAAGQFTYDWPFGMQAGAQIYAASSNGSPMVPCPTASPFGAGLDPAPKCPYTSTVGGCPAGTTQTPTGCQINAPVGSQIPAGGPNIYNTAGLRARYVYVVLPGSARVLSICEMQVMQKKPWVWRRLSGTFNAALLGAATQSSTLTGWGDGQAYRAVDGLVTNNLDNAQPYTLSSTQDGGDTPFAWWQVDMGQSVDVQSVNVFARGEGCCTGRNANMGWFIGESQDNNYNARCTNAPASMSPPCYQPSVAACNARPQDCVSGTNVVAALGAPPTACFRSFTCPVRGRYLQARKMSQDGAAIGLGEVQVIANKLLNQPSGRTGMSVAAFGGCMVIFGGADGAGFRNNEVRFFDMLSVTWLPPFTPIGTTPVARGNAFFALMPPPLNAPSRAFVLFGGYSNTNQLNDVSVLSLPPCPAFDQTGVASIAYFHGATVGYVTCQSYATSANGLDPLVCQRDGTWRGIVPPCAVAPPAAPSGVTATMSVGGVASVSWNALTSAQQGYYNQPADLLSYRVRVAPVEIFEDFSVGRWPAPIAPFNIPCPAAGFSVCGSQYIGGNYYYMLPKIGPGGAGASTRAYSNLTLGVSNTWDFWNGYLRLDCDLFRYQKFDKMDGLIIYRDFPSSIVNPGTGAWAFETFLSLDTFNILSSVDHSVCLGIVDTSDYLNLGVVEFYSCIRNNGGPPNTYQIFQQGSENQWNQDLYSTAPFVSAYTKPYAAYVRIEHDPAYYPQQWTAMFKFNRGDAWINFATRPNENLMREGPIAPQNLRPALLMRNANTQLRAVGLFTYVRIGPIACSDMGTTRLVAGAATSALIYGLTQGTAYRFTVEAQTPAGFGPKSAASSFVTPPVLPTQAVLPLISQGQPCSFSSYYDGAAYPCSNAFDGIFNNFAHDACNRDANGRQWLQVDLGGVREINLVRVFNRVDCCQARLNNFQVWVSSSAGQQYWQSGIGLQCDPSQYNPLISTVPGFTVSFPCYRTGTTTFLSGRYVTFQRTTANVDCLNIAELQVFGSASSPLVSQNALCTMQSVQASSINTCAFADDGRMDTYAQNNNNAPIGVCNNGFGLASQPAPNGINCQNGFLTIDLGVQTAIKSVTLVARQTAEFASWLDGFQLWAHDMPTFAGPDNRKWGTQCNASFFPARMSTQPGFTATVPCIPADGFSWRGMVPAIGRYVSLMAVQNTSFAVVEMQVTSANYALASYNQPCTMSSLYNPFKCNNAFDGIYDNFAHTNGDLDNYITVDLGLSTAVAMVKIHSRKDCCQYRLNNFDFYIGDSSDYHQNVHCPVALMPANELPATPSTAVTFKQYPTGWSLGFRCPLTGRYASMHILNWDNYLNVAEISVFAFNACPIRYATGATELGGSICDGAGWGQVCTHVCRQGWLPVSGATSSTCNGAVWDKPQLVCQPPCNDLPLPTYASSCAQTYFIDSFNIDGALSRMVSLSPWQQLLGIPSSAPPQGSKWFQIDGQIQASSEVSCVADMHLAIANAKINAYTGDFSLGARISTGTIAGLFFVAQDNFNLMRMQFNTLLRTISIIRLVNGNPIVIDYQYSPLITADVFHSVRVDVVSTMINVTFDGVLLISTTDNTYLLGQAGFYAQSQALFDDLTYTAACAACAGLTNGDTCTFGCSAGLIAVGPVSRICRGTTSIATMAYSPPESQPFFCTLAPPTFIPANLFVLENSLVNALVGDPLVAFSSSPDYQVQFSIQAVFAMGAYQVPAANFTQTSLVNQALFYIDICSGQVKLRTGGKDVMNYEGVNSYVLTVRAFIAGFSGAETVLNVTVTVLNLDEPPVVIASTSALAENSARALDGSIVQWRDLQGMLVGTAPSWDPENSTVAYSLAIDGSAGKVLLNPATGAVTVAFNGAAGANSTNATRAAFNFEVLPNVYTLSVTARQVNDSTMFSTASFVVQVVDQNDPPQIAPGQTLSLSEYASTSSALYTVVAGVIAANDEDTNSSWANGTIFSLVNSPSASLAANCAQSSRWPTVDGTQTGAALFSINAVSGAVSLVAMPNTLWGSVTAFVTSGQLVRASYSICVSAADVAGAFSVRSATVNIIADLPNLPYISLVSGLTPDPPTAGGTLVTFTGQNFLPGGIGSVRSVVATYAQVGGLQMNVTNCTVASDTTIVCVTLPGFGVNYFWTVRIGTPLVVIATTGATLVHSYAAPTVTSVSVGAQASPTAGGTVVTFTGSNFGPNPTENARPGYPAAYPWSYPTLWFGNNDYEFACLGTATWSHTSFSCTMPPGIGAGLPWVLTVGGARELTMPPASPANMLLGYLPPTITNVAGVGAVNIALLNTWGGEQVTITGTNFGPATITSRFDGLTRTPMLGDAQYSPTYVKFGTSSGNLLTFAGCTQSPATAHTTITCLTVGGVGVGHRVSMSIGNQAAAAPWPAAGQGLAYSPPTLVSISGQGSNNADTSGGQVVIISGTHFGPVVFPVKTIDYVTYGHPATAPSHYSGQGCTVTAQTATVSQITCSSAPGVGLALKWALSILGQVATGATLLSGYAAPQVFTFGGVGAVDALTTGAQQVLISGKNFGPADAYTNALLSVNYGVVLAQGGPTFLSRIPLVRYNAVGCTVSTAHVQLTCTTVAGAGGGMDWKVTVDGQLSSNPTTNYHAPEVRTITYATGGAAVTAANVNGGEVVLLTGQWFGPVQYNTSKGSLVQKITYGPLGSEVVLSNWTHLSDTQIRCVLQPGIGLGLRFMVTVADQLSPPSTGTFSYAVPSIAYIAPKRAGTYSNPTAAQVVTVFARNLPLLDPTTLYRVTLGQGAYAQTRDISLPTGLDLAGVAAKTNADGTLNGTFTLPQDGAGWGLGVSVQVYQGSLSSLAASTNATRDLSIFSYNDPAITSVTVTRALFYTPGNGSVNPGGDFVPCPSWPAPWSCSDSSTFQLTVNGANFGADPSKMDRVDGVLRSVQLLVQNYTALGLVGIPDLWAASSPGTPTDLVNPLTAGQLYLQSWSHTALKLFVRATAGTLRVQLTTQSTYLQPQGASYVQQVDYAFANLNPTISALTGATTGVPTTGATASVTMTVEGLAGASDFRVFVGGDQTVGLPCVVVCPVGAEVASPATPCDNVAAKIIAPAASGVTTVQFFLPAGQGANLPVVAVTYIGSTPKPSNAGFTVSYAAPVITGFSVLSAAAAAAGAWPSTPTPAVRLDGTLSTLRTGTDGSDRIRVYGTNLGTAPVVTAGDSMVVPRSAIVYCAGAPAQTCIEFNPPAGEGDGSLFPEFNYPARPLPPFGYTLSVSAPKGPPFGQDSNVIDFSYSAPNVTGVSAAVVANATAGASPFPTQGGVTIILTGSNFGVQNPLRQQPPPGSRLGIYVNLTNLLSASGAPDGGAPHVCGDVVRVSQTQIQCTLPEGAGAFLAVSVVVANVAGGSLVDGAFAAVAAYSAPVISLAYVLPNSTVIDPMDVSATVSSFAALGGVVAVPGVNTQLPGAPPRWAPLRGRTEGGDFVVLEGANFGASDTLNCAFLAWWSRSSDALACDGTESFLGEGEVGLPRVVLWTHTMVIFAVGPGLGAKDVQLSVRGSRLVQTRRSARSIMFQYNAPVIDFLTPGAGPTEGVDLASRPVMITLSGSGFGTAPRDTRLAANRITSFPVPLGIAPSLPTALLVVVFHSSCVTQAFDLSGAPLDPSLVVKTANGLTPLNPGCNQGFAAGYPFSATGVSFQLPAGVGANKNVSVVVVDASGDASLTQVSNTASFSYFPPTITGFNPTPVFGQWSPNAAGGVALSNDNSLYDALVADISILGNDFGDVSLSGPTKQNWSPLESQFDVTIAGYPCLTEATRSGLVGPIDGIDRKRTTPPATATNPSPLSSTIVTCQIDFRLVPVGVQNVTIRIAGQSGFDDSWLPPVPDTLPPSVPPTGAFLLVCAPGSYGRVGETCRPCPAQYLGTGILPGATCAGYIGSSRSLDYYRRFPYPRPSAGWYNLNSSDANTLRWGSWGGADPAASQILACPDGFQDAGRDVCIVPCDPPESCIGNNFCAFGYASKPPMWKCSNCDTGFYKRNNECVKCPDSPWALVIGFTLLVAFAGCVGYFLNQKGVNIAVVSIGLDFFQVLAIFATAGVKWPAVIKQLFEILSAFNLNIEIVAPECIVPDLSYKAKFYFIMLLPLSVGCLLGTIFVLVWLHKALIMGQAKKDWFTHRPALVASTLALIYILYLYLTRTIFNVFNCTPTFPPDGYLYLAVASNERCGVPGGTQLTLLPAAVAGLIVYSFGYPSLVFYVLSTNKEKIMLDQLLRAKGTGDDRLTNPIAFELRETFGRSYFQFKPDFCFWILAIILRKFFISITAVVFGKNSSFQMAACLLIMFLAYSAQMMFRPYMNAGEFEAVLKGHVESSFTNAIHARIRAQIANVEARGRKKVRKNLLNFEGKVDRSAVLGLLTSWLFNYNTVEQLMLFAAVIVCLMGIMYQANSSSSFYPGALDGVTAVVMIDVIVAIIYYFTVLFSEIAILYNEDNKRKQLERASRERVGKAAAEASPNKAKSSRDLSGGRLVDEASGEINTGRLETNTNPLFLNSGGDGAKVGGAAGSAGSAGGLSVDIVMAQRSAPEQGQWLLFQAEFASLASQLEASKQQVNDFKRAAAATASTDESDDGRAAVMRKQKAEFAPRAAESAGGGTAKAMLKKKSSKGAQAF